MNVSLKFTINTTGKVIIKVEAGKNTGQIVERPVILNSLICRLKKLDFKDLA